MLRKSLILQFLALAALVSATGASAQKIDGKEDWAQLARLGFAEVISGAYPALDDGEFPAMSENLLGSPSNSYPWGMEWFSPVPTLTAPFLWVGTVRNLLCFLSPGSSEECPDPGDGGLPLPRYPQDAAEIWRYNPGGLGGISGSWLRAWISPEVPFPTKCGFAVAAGGAVTQEEIFAELLACGTAGGEGYPDFPQHIGIRSLEVCGANGSDPNVNRLYASNLGLPARVIHWSNAAATFVDSSYVGDTFVASELADLDLADYDINDPDDLAALTALLLDIAAELPEIDLGYRTLTCWDRPPQGVETEPVTMLCTAPAGSFEDTDGTFHPWVICNEDPSEPTSPWEAHSYFGFGEPEEVGIFDLATVNTPNGQYLCASGLDRVNGGSIWCTDGTGCDISGPADPGAPGKDVQQCVWNKMITDGMGRPAISPILGPLSGPTSNPAAFGVGTMDVDGDGWDDYLYFGMAEAAGGGFAGNALAEMGRIDFRPDIAMVAPEGGGPQIQVPNPNFMKWELVAGLPRILTTSGGDFPNPPPATMNCTPQLYLGFYQACLPTSGRGLGMATSTLGFGPASYLWQFEQHEGSLYVGSLDLIGSFVGDAAGFNIWRSDDGATFVPVNNDGLGWGFTNYGVRRLLSTDATPGVDNTPGAAGPETGGPTPEAPIAESVLFLGAANPYGLQSPLGGAQVWASTFEPNFAPESLAGPDVTIYDDENCDPLDPDNCTPGDGSIDAPMDGSGSYDWFGGEIVLHEWFAGTADCEIIGGLVDTGATPVFLGLAAGDGVGTPFIDYTYTLRVTDDTMPTGLIDCDTVTVRAASNLPPFALFTTVPPFGPDGRVNLVDFDDDGTETFAITARCLDPEGNLATCTWDSVGSGVDLFPERAITDPVTTPITGTYVGQATALVGPDAQALFGDESPVLGLEATDVPTLVDLAEIDVLVSPFVDTASNDTPACGNGTIITLVDTPLTFDPDAPLPGEERFCGDPDGDPLTYASISNLGASSGYLAGSAALSDSDTTITYTPPAALKGPDLFTFNADDGLADPSESATVAAAVRVIDCTLTTPVVHLVIDGETIDQAVETREGCISVNAINSTTVSSADATFTAGERIVVGNGFVIEAGASVVFEINPSVFSE